MNYITIEAKTYEEAVKIARQRYGDKLRIHSRRDIQKKGFLGLGLSKSCEITCFITEDPETSQKKNEDVKEDLLIKSFEQEAITPDPHKKPDISPRHFDPPYAPSVLSEENEIQSETLLLNIKKILTANDFSEIYIKKRLDEIKKQLEKALPAVPSEKEIETTLFDLILGSIDFDYKNNSDFFDKTVVMFGPESCGKTTTMAKVAALYSARAEDNDKKKIAMLSLFPLSGKDEQLTNLAHAMDLPVKICNDQASFSSFFEENKDMKAILVDTKQTEKLYNVFKNIERNDYMFCLVLPATMKYSDLYKTASVYGAYNIKAVIATMTDLTGTIGNIISICSDRMLPLIFFTDGRKIPQDIKRASSSFLASHLKGFSIDLTQLLKHS